MPNSQSESKNKQPTGSSKRKRKQSIKRNIVLEESTDSEDIKSEKIEKTYSKRTRGDKARSKDLEIKITDKKTEEFSCQNRLKIRSESELIAQTSTTDGELKNCDSNTTQCGVSKEQCQNCKFCSEHVQTKQTLDETKDKQTRTKRKFSCEICAKEGIYKVYSTAEKHKYHMAMAHEIYGDDIKKFECTECTDPVWFASKAKFVYHLGTKHPGIIKFVCEICTETFKLKANYKNHLKTHNIVVQKKFSCEVCNGTFVNKGGFEAHKRRFPGPHIKQSCSHCGFSFSKEKHMRNHRCKTLLLEQAAARGSNSQVQETVFQPTDPLKLTAVELKSSADDPQIYVDKKAAETFTENDLNQKKTAIEGDSQGNKRVVFHRILPKRNPEQTIYRPVQVQNQNVSEPVVVQELREIDFEGGTFIAAPAEPEQQQFIVRDLNGHLVQGNQILQLDINDVHSGEESQVYLADWNIVAPYVIREKSP